MLPYVELKLCDVSDGNLRVVRRRNCFSKLLVFSVEEVAAGSFCLRRPFGPWLNLAKCTWDVTYCYRAHNLCERMLTPASVFRMYPLAPSSHMTIRCGLLEKPNGINAGFLFRRADLRTILFSASSVVRPLFYCPKPFHIECL
jgi:hypothetical protein